MPRRMTGRYERVEVITGVARRRRWSAGEKLRIVGDLSRPGASVSSVARDHDLNPSLLFKWRRLAREGAFGLLPDDGPSFVPIRLVTAESPSPVETAPGSPAGEAGGSMVEIALPNGCRLRVPAAIDGAALRRLVTVLKTAV
jgi:transposase